MGESKRRCEATRSEKRGATLRRRFGDGPFDLCIFPLVEVALKPPRSPDDLLAIWKAIIGAETLKRQERGELYCLLCDGAIAVEPPPAVGFIKPDDLESDLAGFSICGSCFGATETLEELRAMVAAAYNGTIAPDPSYN
jgi:hypothetical protein